MILTFIVSLLFLVVAYHFLNIFHMLDNDIEKTFNWYKNKLNSILNNEKNNISFKKNKTSIKPKENLERKKEKTFSEKNNVESTEEISAIFQNMFKFTPRNSYEEAAQDKIINFLSNNPSYFIKDGERKLVVPLESIVFLNKEIPPLVTEDGNILIKIDIVEKINDADVLCLTSEEKELKELIEFYGIENLKNELKKYHKYRDKISNKKYLKENSDNKIKEEQINNEIKKENNDIKIKKEQNNNSNVKKADKKQTDNINQDNLNDLLDNEEEEDELSPSSVHNLDDLLEDFENDFLNDNEEENTEANKKESNEEENTEAIEKNNNVKMEDVKIQNKNDFFKNKKWEIIPNMFLNFSNIEESLMSLLEEHKYEFFNNIVKHKFLIFNQNKTAVFIDKIVIMNSIARMGGNKYKEISSKFSRLRGIREKEFFNTLKEFFKEYAVDPEYVFKKEYFEKNGVSFFGYGTWVSIDSFEMFLNDDFDFFRTYPYSFGYNITTNGDKPLIVNNTDIEI